MADILCWINHRFDVTYSKGLFIYHNTREGMTEGELSEARENTAWIEKDLEDPEISWCGME